MSTPKLGHRALSYCQSGEGTYLDIAGGLQPHLAGRIGEAADSRAENVRLMSGRMLILTGRVHYMLQTT